MKATGNFLYDSPWAWILTPAIPEYEQGMLTTTRQCSSCLLEHFKYRLESLRHCMKYYEVGNTETLILRHSCISIRRDV
jgi:hypothetical protein